jgi:hypothetical protein
VIQWNQAVIDGLAETIRKQAQTRAKPALEQTIDGRFDLHEMPSGFSFGADGLDAEFGTVMSPGTPWIMRALKGVADGGH